MALRLFAALPIPDAVAARLAALQRGVPGAKWRPIEAFHVTLRFFGEVREDVADDLDQELETLARGAAPFDLALKGAGSFGGADPHALWIGVAENPALRRLAAGCERAARRAGLAPETRKYAPHVTLAYLSGAALDRVQAFESRLGLFATEPWTADGFALFSSWSHRGGPNSYEVERAYRLGA